MSLQKCNNNKPITVNYRDEHFSERFQRALTLVANIRTNIKQLQKNRKC